MGAITRRVDRRAGGAAVLHSSAMRVGRVGLAEMPLGNAVKAEEHVIVRLGQIRRRDGVERLDVIGVGVEGLRAGDPKLWRKTRSFVVDLHHHRLPGGCPLRFHWALRR